MTSIARRWLVLIAVYVALAVVWVVGASCVAPGLYRIEAGLLALGLGLALALGLESWDDRFAASRSLESRRRDRGVNLALVLTASAFLGVTVRTGAVHDYVLYLRHWSDIWEGNDPWALESVFGGMNPSNAYGPIYNMFAGLSLVNRLIPKLLFASAYIATAAALIKGLFARRALRGLAVIGIMIWASTPYAWVEIAIRGHFDVLVGVASVAATHERRRGRDVPCAVALAAGVLLKFFPVVLIPFLALDRRRVRFRLVAIAAGLIALGMGLSCLVWGPSTFRPVSFAATRSSTYLSIFRFLRGGYSPLRAWGLEPDVDWLALPVLGLALLATWLWCRARAVDPATAAFLASLATVLLYPNGFPQYQMVPLMLASYWVAETWNDRRHRTALAIALVGYFGWIAAFDITYCLIGDGSPRFEDAVGLPTFVIGSALATCVVWSEPRRRQD
jgi:hypothetical protein